MLGCWLLLCIYIVPLVVLLQKSYRGQFLGDLKDNDNLNSLYHHSNYSKLKAYTLLSRNQIFIQPNNNMKNFSHNKNIINCSRFFTII